MIHRRTFMHSIALALLAVVFLCGTLIGYRLARRSSRDQDNPPPDQLSDLESYDGPICSIVLSPDGKYLITGEGTVRMPMSGYIASGNLKVWDPKTGQFLENFRPDYNACVSETTFSPDGKWFATHGLERYPPERIKEGDEATWRLHIWEFSRRTQVNLDVADLEPGNPYYVVRPPSADVFHKVAFSKDSTQVALVDYAGNVGIYQLGTFVLQRSIREPLARDVSLVGFGPDASHLVTLTWVGTAKLWDCRTGELCDKVKLERAMAECLSPDGSLLAVSDNRGALTLLGVSDRFSIRELKHQGEDIVELAFAPSGALLASATFNGVVQIWDMEDERLLLTLPEFEDRARINCMCFSRDGTELYATVEMKNDKKRLIKKWNVRGKN